MGLSTPIRHVSGEAKPPAIHPGLRAPSLVIVLRDHPLIGFDDQLAFGVSEICVAASDCFQSPLVDSGLLRQPYVVALSNQTHNILFC